MGLSVRGYDERPGGGYAVVEGASLSEVPAICIENRLSGLFLDGEGRWTKMRTALPVMPVPGRTNALLLGPHIVDFIPTDLQVALYTAAGLELGRVFWTDIIPSRNPGVITGVKFVQDETSRRDAEIRREQEARAEAEAQTRAEAEAVAQRDVAQRAVQEAKARTLEAEARARREREEAERDRAAGTEDSRDRRRRRWGLLWLAAIPAAVAAWLALQPAPGPVPVAERPAPPSPPPVPVQPPAPPPAQVPAQPLVEQQSAATEERSRPEPPRPRVPSARTLVERTTQQASFECRPSMAEPAAQLICADADLASADGHLGRAFQQRLNTLSPDDRRGFIAEQRVWIGRRNRICGVPMTGSYSPSSLIAYKFCFLQMMEQRTGELEGN